MNLHGSDFEAGKIIEMIFSDRGSWLESAMPPSYTVAVWGVYLESKDESGIDLRTDQEIEFSVNDDDTEWHGIGTGIIMNINRINGPEVHVTLKFGEITYTGPTPLQSQTGRE